MNDIQNVMKFEFLPNEILIQCLGYLNGFEIYNSFDRLNNRFNKLIYSIPLQLNFEYINKSIFDKFCTNILLNSQIKNQIYSLKLSNAPTCYQIEIFLSYFSLEEFCNLQSLTLIDFNDNDIQKLKLMLPFIFQLSSLHLIPSDLDSISEGIDFSLSKIRTLSLLYLNYFMSIVHETSSIINLTILGFDFVDIYQLLERIPMLKYLNIKRLCYSKLEDIEIYSNNQRALHLKKLIINVYDDNHKNQFPITERLLKQMPNLKSLTLSDSPAEHIIDAYQWEHLIKSSLPYLDIFKFKFSCYLNRNDVNTIINKFKEFQNDFWQKEHHWYTEYVIQEYSAYIYTLPYVSNESKVELNTIRYSNNLINNVNTFDNVTDLTLYTYTLEGNYECYFSNVTSLTLNSYNLTKQSVKYLKRIVNLFNLKNLRFYSYNSIENSSLFLKLLKQTPQLSSLLIDIDALILFLNDSELCKYLSKMIKRLVLYYGPYRRLPELFKVKQFCETFINIEHLEYTALSHDDLSFLLRNLPKLSNMKVTWWNFNSDDIKENLRRFKSEASKLNMIFQIVPTNYETSTLARKCDKIHISIWMGKKHDLIN